MKIAELIFNNEVTMDGKLLWYACYFKRGFWREEKEEEIGNNYWYQHWFWFGKKHTGKTFKFKIRKL